MTGQETINKMRDRLEELLAIPRPDKIAIDDILRYREIRMLLKNLQRYRVMRDRPHEFEIDV